MAPNQQYPIGIQDLAKIINTDCTYIDKTDLIYDLANNGSVYFLSRPRRFGKSLLLSTLRYYFEGRRDIFRGLKIDSLEADWKCFPVVNISFADGEYTFNGLLEQKIDGMVSELEEMYQSKPLDSSISSRFKAAIQAAHAKTGLPVVILVDEYDKPLLDNLGLHKEVSHNDEVITLEEKNRRVLKEFYSVFKSVDEHLRFVILTGVTKFSQISVFSGFNQPQDISMDPHYDALCGITEDELHHYFDSRIGEMADSQGVTKNEMYALLKRNYDGYHFSSKMLDIYNPFSIINALKTGELADYWFASGGTSSLLRIIAQNDSDLSDLINKWYPTSEFIDYKADVERPLPMLYQTGYLTIKKANPRLRAFMLDLPNNEVRNGFVSLQNTSHLTK